MKQKDKSLVEKLEHYQRLYDHCYRKIDNIIEKELEAWHDPNISVLPDGDLYLHGKPATREEVQQYINNLKH